MERRIPIIQLDQLVREGNGVSEIARKLGVTKGAVSKALKKLNQKVAADVTMRAAPAIVNRQIDLAAQMAKINDVVNAELDSIRDSLAEAKGEDLEKLRDQQLKHVGELRKQVGLITDILRGLSDSREIAHFMQIVLEEIGDAAPEVRQKIYERLVSRGAVAGTFGLFSPHARV